MSKTSSESQIANTDIKTGLRAEQVSSARKNVAAHHQSNFELAFFIFKKQVASFFFILLVVAGGLSLLLGEKVDASVFFAIALINLILGFIQEFRANKSAQSLEKMVAHMVTVRRDSVLVTIPHTDVVLGDIILLNSGDVAVVDIRILACKDVFLDESVLTGETMPRQVHESEELLSGVTVVSGNLVGQVIAVGRESSLMQYAEKIENTRKNSNFEKFVRLISVTIVIITVICLALVFVVNVLIGQGIPLSEYILFSISMLIGVVPESLPLIISIILTREALQLAKKEVLIKKLSVLENLGSMNFLFTDKTGTITENTLKVKKIIVEAEKITENLAQISFGMYERTPMDAVFDASIGSYLETQGFNKKIYETLTIESSPFQLERGYAVHELPDGGTIIRGQYSAISKMCNGNTDQFLLLCNESETNGLRIIATAYKAKDGSEFSLQGAVVFEDPLKIDAIEMYTSLTNFGINVKILTGDSPQVAQYVAKILHPKPRSHFVFDMKSWVPDGTDEIEKYFVYARCKPDQKSMLIDEHLDHGAIGFLGEGINDALALKRSDVSFVVNNGSDVARQAGDVILLQKGLSPILSAVTMSRQALVKIRTYLLCTLTGNIGTLFSLSAIVIFWQQIPILPIQILLNNVLTDLPLIFLITDTVSPKALALPIKDETKKFFKIIIIFAAISSLFDFIFFFAFSGYDISVIRTGWFVFSVLAELTLVFSLRSELSIFKAPAMSKILGTVLVGSYATALLLPYASFNSVFHLEPLSSLQMAIIVGITVVYLCANEFFKSALKSNFFRSKVV